VLVCPEDSRSPEKKPPESGHLFSAERLFSGKSGREIAYGVLLLVWAGMVVQVRTLRYRWPTANLQPW
jgi:hypothetical protein